MAEVSAKVDGASTDILSYRGSYEAVREEVAAVPEEWLLHITVDIPAAVTTVLGALPEIHSLRARLIDELPRFDIARFDKLETYARALYHANALLAAASMPPGVVQALAQECSALAATFRKDAEALAHRGLIEGNLLRNLRNGTGYRDIAFDLYLLTQVLREHWPKIEGKTALQLAEVQQAEMLADRLNTAVGLREQSPAIVGDASDTRDRAFALFIRTYNQVRRAISYLEPEHVDEIVPTLYAARGPGKKKGEADKPAQPEAPVAAAPNGAPISGATKPANDDDSPFVP